MWKIGLVLAVIPLSITSAGAQSCWGCMHGCTDKQRIEICHLNRTDLRKKEQECIQDYMRRLNRPPGVTEAQAEAEEHCRQFHRPAH